MNITTHCSSGTIQVDPIFSFFSHPIALSGLTVHMTQDQQQCIALVDLAQAGKLIDRKESTLLDLLSTQEQNYFKRFSYPKRRQEWLGGRIAAKTALSGLAQSGIVPDKLRQISVLPDELGRPKADRMSELGISISHSSGFAVALAAGGSCGIDLQKISSKLPKLTDRFTRQQEISLLAGLNGIEQTTLLTMIWTAKESIKKSMLSDQPGIFDGIEILQASAVDSNTYSLLCSVRRNRQQSVRVYDFSPYILALTGADNHA